MTGSPPLDRQTVLQFVHHLTHTPVQEKGSEDMHLCVFVVMGHCLHHIHFPLSVGWFPFRKKEQNERCTLYFYIELVVDYSGITEPYVIMKESSVSISSGSNP